MKALLGGFHADALGPVGWSFITGARPFVQGFEMDAGEAGALINQGGKISLEIQDKKVLRVDNLEIIGETVSSAPLFRTVLVADLRWRWSRKHVHARYNVRRRTGQKRLLNEGLIELAQVADIFKFGVFSLKGGNTKYQPREVLEDVLGKLQSTGGFGWRFDGDTDELEVNDLELAHPGDEAVEEAMRFLPGASVWVDKTGTVVVQSAVGLQESGVIQTSGPEIIGGGHVSKVSYKYTRPSKIRVYFVREQELRVDSRIEDSEIVEGDQREMDNVVLVTDPFITVAGESVNYGSWVRFEQAFPYWNDTKAIDGAFDISHDFIQKTFFEDNLFNVHVPWGGEDAQPIWMGRIQAIKQHYRQTYQINRRWMDRVYKVMDHRAALLDPTTVTRGRAQAFGGYCRKLSSRHIGTDPAKQFLWKSEGPDINDPTSARVPGELNGARVSPALVQVWDEQAGIVHLNFQLDRYGEYVQIYPSQMINLPSANVGDSHPKGVGMRVGRQGAFPQLIPDHQVAVVLTAVPGAPNDNSQLYMVEVEPKDVEDKVKGLEIDPSEGPVWELFADPGLIQARVAWIDAHAATIERSFGVGVAQPALGDQAGALAAVEQAQQDKEILEQLVINLEDLTQWSQSVAATLWSRMSDRHIGSKTVRMDPSVGISGSIEEVTHRVDAQGSVVTEINLPEELRERDPFALLSPGTRRTILREV